MDSVERTRRSIHFEKPDRLPLWGKRAGPYTTDTTNVHFAYLTEADGVWKNWGDLSCWQATGNGEEINSHAIVCFLRMPALDHGDRHLLDVGYAGQTAAV